MRMKNNNHALKGFLLLTSLIVSSSAYSNSDVMTSGNISISGILKADNHCVLDIDMDKQFESSDFIESNVSLKPTDVIVKCVSKTRYELVTDPDPKVFRSKNGEVSIQLLKAGCEQYGSVSNEDLTIESIADANTKNIHNYCWVIEKTKGQYEGEIDSQVEVGLVSKLL